MARKRALSKKQPKFVAPLVGDVFRDASPIADPHNTPAILLDDTNKIPLRKLIQYALQLGHDPKIVCGVDLCTEHKSWLVFTDRFSNTSKKTGQYTYGIDVVWCRQCLAWYRDPKPQNLPDDYVAPE